MSNPLALVEAVNLALFDAMKDDDNVVVLGQDVAVNGGVFRATDKLAEHYPKRVLDTPLAESLIAGLSVGMATQGLKPVAEFQFEGFIYPALNQICNHAARLRNRSRGKFHCPIVFRAPWGGGIHAPEHHSDSPEAILCHTPGLQVVIPSSPARAYGLLLAAVKNPDPIIFFEPKRHYRSPKQAIEARYEPLPIGKAFVLKKGADVTLITWGALVRETLAVTMLLEAEGISCEVIDVATLKPLDTKTLIYSVKKTGRCCIIHEAPKTCGFGAEVAARVSEEAWDYLRAPVKRVTGFDTIMPYAKLEKNYLPSEKRIYDSIKQLVGKTS